MNYPFIKMILEGREVLVYFVPKKTLEPFFGIAVGGIKEKKCYAVVRNDLPKMAQAFVIDHELYHLRDQSNFLGCLGREIRANLNAAIHHPLGLIVTIALTISKRDRIKFYLERFRLKY